VPKEGVTVSGAMNIKGANVSYRIEGEAETTKDRIAIGAATGISLNACEKWLKEGEAINQSINDDVRTRWSPDSEVAWHGGVNFGVRGHMREARGRQGRTAEVAGG
jgi:hypothetical protein